MTVGMMIAGSDPADVRSILVATPSFTVIPDNVDLAAIGSDLADDHVAAPADEVTGLEKVVTAARDKGHEMSFVVLADQQPNFTYYRDIATALQKEVGGTVIVFGPDTIGTASDDFSRVQLEQAQDNLDVANPAVGARQMLDRMTEQTQIPWTAVTVVLVALVALGAVAARFLQLRRRTAPPATPVATTAAGSATESDARDPDHPGSPPRG